MVIPALGLAAAGWLTAAAEEPAYVGSEVCANCHQDEASAWSGSHHAMAWNLPSEKTVLGDFDHARFEHDGMRVRFRRIDGRYVITVSEAGDEPRDHEVRATVGVAPLQQYLIETEPGRLQSFDVVWDVERERWYHLYPDETLRPGDGLHWTGPYKTWNARCAECHATGYEKGYDMRTRRYASTQAEIGVGCEACHGPGSAHLARVEEGVPPEGAGPEAHGFSITFGASAATDIEQCAGCHSRRGAFGASSPVPGTPFPDAYDLATLRPGLYHADGQILDEVYVYGSFLQSKMHAQGVDCMNCHDPHTARTRAEGDAICLQCHSPAGNPDFPTLRSADYDAPAHHFHDPESEGARCVSCHMPARTYMGVDDRRDHGFRIPRPDLSAATGAPDACTGCHEGETADWAAARIAEHHPNSHRRGRHWGERLAAGRERPDLAAASLVTLATDGSKPAIARASALDLLAASGQAQAAERTATLLSDPSPLVRGHAVPVQRLAPLEVRLRRLVPLLDDPVAAVRITAARELLDAPPAAIPPERREVLVSAREEWQAALRANLDFPETHLAIGGAALALRNPRAAERAFREAVTLDPQRREAWIMLVRITAATAGRAAAREVAAEALQELPDDPDLTRLATDLSR